MSSTKFQAVVITAPGKAEVREFESRPLKPHEIRIANTATAVSFGTEYLVVSNQLHGCTLPALLGYQGVGKIIEIGPEVSGCKIGERVCSGGSNFQPEGFGQGAGNAHASQAIINDKGDWAQQVLVKIPDAVSDDEAAYAWLASVSQQGVEMAKLKPGEIVAVVGLGMVGQFAAQLARAAGARVYACDLSDERAKAAAQYSADVALTGGVAELNSRIREEHKAGADVVIECTGNTKVLDASIELLKLFGRLVLQGHYPGMINMRHGPLHSVRATLYCPCAWGDLRPILRHMETGKVTVKPWIRETFTPAQVPELYDRIARRDPTLSATVIRWS